MSTSTSSLLLKAFNKHFFEFVDDMILLFPENNDIQTSRQYFDTLKHANPTLLIKIWHNFIYTPYHEPIENGDLKFFFEKDYAHDIRLMPNSEKVLQVIDNTLREPLKNMDEENTQKCCKHFQLVTKICAKYMEEK